MKKHRRPRTPIGWFFHLSWRHREDFWSTPRTDCHPHPWPDGRGFDPLRNPVFARNTRVLKGVTPAQVFDVLIQPSGWPAFYENARATNREDAPERLIAGSRFVFRTFGTRQRCVVREFQAPGLIAWEARMPGNAAYHRWLLEPVEGGTQVVTEECQTGLLASLNPAMNPALHATHELWLRGLEAHLRAGG